MRYLEVATLSVLLLVLSGCSGESIPENTDPFDCENGELLCLEPPERGFQIQSVGDTIAPGQDVEYCEVVTLPGTADDIYYVKEFELAMTKFSHHLIVSAAIPDSPTEQNMADGEKVKCIGARIFGDELVPVAGSQVPYATESFPDGVGRIYRGGQKLVFDYHYLNTSSEPVSARAAVNFHTVDAAEVSRFAHSFGFYNLSIHIDPGQEASFSKTCSFSQDVMVHKLTRHTHQWGTDFEVHYAGGTQDGEMVFRSSHYEDIDHTFPEPILMKAGTGFSFDCTFRNTNDYPLQFGVKASDEMCILFGTWFVVNDDDPVSTQGCFGL